MRNALIILCALLLSAVGVQAQVEYVDINLTNGTKVSYPIGSVGSIAFHTEATPGDGSEKHPYKPTEAIVAYEAQTAAQMVWVKGVIVGSVTDKYISSATFGADAASDTNLLIADTRWENGVSRCLVVQLPAGAIRTDLSLSQHPENLYHEVTIYGSLEKYYGVAGLKTPKQYALGPLTSDVISTDAKHPGRMEVPALVEGDEFIAHHAFKTDQTTERTPNFYVSYSPLQHHSHWVAFRFDDTTRQKNTTRSGGTSYPADPDCLSSLPGNAFAGTGYDHGHLCASADRLYSTQANEQTFYMSNMSPQLPQFNRTYWNYYETHVQNLGRDAAFSDTLYVVKGGTIDNVPDSGLERAVMTTLSSDGAQVPVPQYYFMALLKVKDGQYAAAAFWMEHKEYDTVSDKQAELRGHIITIDELERRTGFDFFPCLPDATEKAVEASATPSEWGLPL